MSFFSFATTVGILIGALTASAQQTLPGHVPEAITRLHLPPTGRLPSTNQLHLVLQLPLRHRDALTNFLAELYNPASTNYHKYLTKEQFTEQFGPTTNDYQAVIEFAQSHGLQVGAPHRSRLTLDVRGQVADIETAFHVTLRTYRHPTESRTFYAPDADPSLGAGVPILEIGGLSDYPKAHSASHAQKITGKSGLASGTGYGGNYQGKDFRNAYIPGSSLAGSGQMVGLFELDGYYPNDIALYEKFSGLTNVPLQNVLIDGFSGTPGDNNLEVALDIEMVVAMAPALASVVVFECPNSYADGVNILDSMANNTQISQFSSSFGFFGTSPYNYYDQALETLAAQGQSFFMASGDGDAWTQTIWVPAANPYVTAVGGTTLTMTSGGAAYTSETVWNSGTTFGSWNGSPDTGSGGGVSSYYSIPSWQTGINMTTNLGSSTARNIPDVAMVGIDCSIVYNNGDTNSYGYGTSIAAPMWAAFTALINQQAAASHKLPVGLLNPTIYPLLQNASYTNAFHDIATGNNYSANSTTKYPATPGYDLCTGLGSPRGTNFINAVVATLTAETAPTITVQPASQTVAVGAAASFSLTVTGTAPFEYFWLRGGAFMTGQTNASFTTNNVQSAGSGTQFRCVVSNAVGSVTSQVATLTVQAPPTILATSPTNQTVAVGGSASFTVNVSGSPPLGYSWMCNGTPIPGANAATYVTNDVQAAESGAEFSCQVTNEVGTDTSQSATLTVESAPGITAEPVSETIAVGTSATFSVTASGTAPLNYFWLSNSVFMAGQTNATFITNNVQLANSGQQFSCLVSNTVGSVTSIVATLTVESPPIIFASSPTNKTVPAGSSATFAVTASGTAPLGYYWICNGTFISGANSSTYTTNNVQLSESGAQFSCVVSNTVGMATSKMATLTVDSPPSITTQPASQTVAVGATASFALTATGTTPLNYFWLSNSVFMTGQTNATFTTNDVQLANSGQKFSCIVSNPVGSVTSTIATLTVDLPPSITADPANETVAVGATASFAVTATGTTPLNYFWLSNSVFMAGQTNATFTTNNVQLANSGQQFSCLVSNPVGSVTSIVATLTVDSPPSVTTEPVSQTVAAGATASFSVTATGTTPLSYSWLSNSVFMAGQTNATFTTNNVQLANSGQQFSCIVSNPVGSVTSTVAILTVDLPPGITTEPITQTVAAGATASFSVIATGTTPLNYFWLSSSVFMAGQTNATFTTNNVQFANSGQQFSCIVSNPVGSVTSTVATLTVDLPPSITMQPTNETVAAGATATFIVTATGTALNYFWLGGGSPLPNQTNATFVTNNVPLASSGQEFSCVVSNAVGSVTSLLATLTVEVPPAIVSPPTNQTSGIGGSATFNVTASGTPLSYFWMGNAVSIPGATNATFTTNNLQLANSGQQYSCLVSNAVGSVTSQAALLTVAVGAAQAPSFQISLSGSNLILTGSNGVAGGTYLLLMTTDLTAPLNQWTPVTTNILGASGAFTLTATNAATPNAPEQFYLLQVH